MKKLIWSLLVLSFIGLVSFLISRTYSSSKLQGVYAPAQMGVIQPHFEIASHEKSKTYDTKILSQEFVLLVYLGFSLCPDVCPMTLHDIKRELKSVHDIEKKLRVLFISVDHRRDSALDAYQYAQNFGTWFLGTSESKKKIDEIVKGLGAFYEYFEMPKSELKFTVDHTSRLYIYDKGEMKAVMRTSELKNNLFQYLKDKLK